MKKNTFEIQLPFFPGFYESALYNCDTLYWETHGDELDYYRERFDDDTLEPDDLDIDFSRYCEDCCKEFIEVFHNNQDCPAFIKTMEMSEMTSPRYYNFETDKLYVNVEFDEDWRDVVKAFMDEEKDWLTKRIKDDWTSCDGFWSYLENDYDYWYEELQKDEPDVRYIGIMVGYMMYRSNNQIKDDLIYSTLEDFYVGEYIINTKENA